MHFKLWALPLLLLINISYGAGFMNNKGMYVSTQAEEEKRYQENPNPKKLYRVTINIENAPGEFKKNSASTTFQAPNCQYLKKGFAGATGEPYHRISFELKKISDTQYQGEFYMDGMLDEDYGYGNGTCHWTLTGIGIAFISDDNENNTRFNAPISGKDLDQKFFEFNHLKEFYPEKEGIKIKKYPSLGRLSKEKFTPEEYFTFYVNIEEVK